MCEGLFGCGGPGGPARAEADTELAEVEGSALLFLEGEVGVYYSEGHLQRAKDLQAVVEDASDYFAVPEVLDLALELTLVVLDPEDWGAVSRRPYGVPHVWALPDEPKLAFMPAAGESPIAALNLALKERLPAARLEAFSDLGLSFDEAAVRFADLILLHEIGHAYAFGYLTYFPQRWLNEFLATYLAYAYFSERDPEAAKLWAAMNDVLVEASEHPHTTLADFDRLYIRGVGLENYGWYQGKFQQRAAEVFEAAGPGFLHAFRESWIETPDAPPEDPRRLGQLEAVHPGFTAWASGADGDLGAAP